MTFYQVAILGLYICYQIGYSHAMNEAQVDLFRQYCPYTGFCTSNGTEDLSLRPDITPCCMDCFCDSHCWAYEDCCPDMMLVGQSQQQDNAALIQPVCKPAIFQNEYTGPIDNFRYKVPSYRIIDACPLGYNDAKMTREKCEANFTTLPTYDDIVMVSTDDYRLFQNKHCARCHGVQQTTRWDLQILGCRRGLENADLSASETRRYMMENCSLWSARPSSVPLNGRTMDCNLISACSSDADQNVIDACTNGPFMPYTQNIGRKGQFRNVMCFKCASSNRVQSQECIEHDFDASKGVMKTFQAIIDMKSDESDSKTTTSSKCGESYIYDPFTASCRRMYCPVLSVVYYGRCLPISKRILNMNIFLRIVFTPMETNLELAPDTINRYSTDKVEFYMDRLSKKVKLTKCKIDRYIVEVIQEKGSKRFAFLNARLGITVDESCSLEYIGEVIQNSGAINITWLINEDFIPMEGRYSFALSDRIYHRSDLLHKSSGFTLTDSNIRFFVCPHVILSHDEYNKRITVGDNEGENITIGEISPLTKLENGYYFLTKTEIAACTHKYLQQGNFGSFRESNLLALLMGMIFNVMSIYLSV